MGDVSKNFSMSEFLVSQTAARLGKEIVPDRDEENYLRLLIKQTMQPIRDMLDAPVIITSGLRPKWLNELIGGSRTSQHMRGQAADFRVVGMEPYAVCMKIAENEDIPYDQLIHEFGSWIHISYVPGMTRRRENLTASSDGEGGTKYVYEIQRV